MPVISMMTVMPFAVVDALDVDVGIDQRAAAEADRALGHIEILAREGIGAADEVEPAADLRARCWCHRRAGSSTIRTPAPCPTRTTGSAALIVRSSLNSPVGAAGAGRSVASVGWHIALAPDAGQFGHLGRALADDRIACVGDRQRALDQPALRAVGQVDVAGRGRAQCVALRQLRIVQRRLDIDREAAVRRQPDRSLAPSRCHPRPSRRAWRSSACRW